LLFFPWFRLFDERYLQCKEYIIIERSELNRICALRMDLFAIVRYTVNSGWCPQKDNPYSREVVICKGRLEGGGGRDPARGGKNLSSISFVCYTANTLSY